MTHSQASTSVAPDIMRTGALCWQFFRHRVHPNHRLSDCFSSSTHGSNWIWVFSNAKESEKDEPEWLSPKTDKSNHIGICKL